MSNSTSESVKLDNKCGVEGCPHTRLPPLKGVDEELRKALVALHDQEGWAIFGPDTVWDKPNFDGVVEMVETFEL